MRPVVAILAALVLVALLVLLLMANNRGLAPSSSEPPRLLSLPVYESSGGSDAALIQGELEVRGRCLLLVTAEDTVGVAWPMPGTRWDASTATIEVRGTTARVGERVELGGSGVLVTPAVVSSLGWIGPRNPGCLSETLWFAGVIQPIE